MMRALIDAKQRDGMVAVREQRTEANGTEHKRWPDAQPCALREALALKRSSDKRIVAKT